MNTKINAYNTILVFADSKGNSVENEQYNIPYTMLKRLATTLLSKECKSWCKGLRYCQLLKKLKFRLFHAPSDNEEMTEQ